jgi:acid phosphatase
MRRAIFIIAVFVLSCPLMGRSGLCGGQSPEPNASAPTWVSGLPVYDHIVIVVEENKNYEEIIGNPKAPYINNVLKVEGANLTQMYGEEHYSQGNYFWLFSGDNQTVGFSDDIPSEKNNPNYPFTARNLGEQLIKKGLSFKGYSEGLPKVGSIVDEDKDSLYARKHVPWISFANVPNGDSPATSSNLGFKEFPSDPSRYETLPTVAFVIPNLKNDMHNGKIEDSIPAGDLWLRKNIDSYYRWAKNHNSLLILTFDENDDKRSYRGLTNPLVDPKDPKSCSGAGRDPEYCLDLQNRIVTIIAGAHIRAGDYDEGKGITHVNLLRTIEAMYGLSKSGVQQPNAAGGGITDSFIITDVFDMAR